MSTDRTQRLSPSELALKLACREMVKAAGGQEFVAHETGRTQSRISDYLSPNTRDFMPCDLVRKVEALSAGAPGHPHVTRALARAQGGAFVALADGAAVAVLVGAPQLGQLLAAVAGESSDVIALLAASQLEATIDELPPATREAIADECFELVEQVAAIERRLRNYDRAGSDTS